MAKPRYKGRRGRPGRAKPKGRSRQKPMFQLRRMRSRVERSPSASSVNSCSTCSSRSRTSSVPEASTIYAPREPVQKSKSFTRIKHGIMKSVPTAVVLWAFHKLPSNKGLTSRRVIDFLKTKSKPATAARTRNVSETIGDMLRKAVDCGLLEKRGARFYIKKKKRRDARDSDDYD